jgi:signal peptidase II
MKLHKIIRNLLLILILTANVGCDQISKSFVRQNIIYDDKIALFESYLTLTKVENTGAFLSMGHSLPQPFKILILTILPLCMLGFTLYFVLSREKLSNWMAWGICFIVGGGIGNLFDRIVYGSVTDFLHIDLGFFQTGIFNMADVSIVTGTLMIFFAYLKTSFSRAY